MMKRTAVVIAGALSLADASTSVVLCGGDFIARQSACDSVSADVRDLVPSENYACTEAAEPGVLSAFLRDGKFGGWIPAAINLDSQGEVMRLMNALPVTPATIEVIFNDCNSPKSLPPLEAGKQYAAVILLDNAAAEGSVALNIGTNDSNTRVEMKSRIVFIEYGLLNSKDFRTFLQDEFSKCQGSHICELKYDSRLITREATLIMESYLSSLVKLPKQVSFYQH